MLRRNLLNYIKRAYAQDLKKESEIKKIVAAEKFQQKAIRVTIIGADTSPGEALALLLKVNPLISHLYLHCEDATGIAADLSHIDTRTIVTSYKGNDLDKAVRRGEVIVILPEGKYGNIVTTAEDKFRSEYERLIKIFRTCTVFAPKSLLYICVPPISMSVPLAAGIFRKTHWYHPGRIIGSMAFQQIKLNSLLARYNNLDPAGVHVPIVGGPDVDCMVPLFSRATPVPCEPQQATFLTKRIKNIPICEPVTMEIKQMEFPDGAPLSQAFAINRSITTIALGLLGDQKANMTGFIRSNILSTCSHLTATIRIGSGGVIHNFGLPILTPMELELMEKAALVLDEREKEALTILQMVEDRRAAMKIN